MKLLLLSFLVIAAGCDTPTRSRFPSTITGDPITAPEGGFLPGTTAGSTTAGSTTAGSTTSGSTTGGTTGFENCNLTTRSSSTDTGSIGVCKNSLDETQIRFVSSLGDSTRRTCLIPTYKDQYGNSTYLGDPQCTYTEAEKIYTGRLVKNRPGMAQYPITGVMVMKENLLVEYFACMDSYMKYISYYCPSNPTYAPCVSGATNYRNSVCNNFKQKYPNSYLDLYLR